MLRMILSSTGSFYFTILNLLYPQDCLICSNRIHEAKDARLCAPCNNRIMRYADTPHWSFTEQGLAFDAAYHVADYDDIVKRCICLMKYGGKRQLSDTLGGLMTEYAERNMNFNSIDMFVPVPLHPVKLRERQFNQSDLIAGHLAQKFNKKLENKWIKRIRYTPQQAGLSRDKRFRNIKGAFLVRQDADFYGKSVMLIDDVMATGATLHECAKAIKSAGAKKVYAFTLARGN